MTKEEWNKIKDWWGTGLCHVKLLIDGYDVCLYNRINKEKMTMHVVIYVDGYLKSECFDVKNEIGNRFWQRIKKPLYSPKEMKGRIKAFGKRSSLAQQRYYEYNNCDWRSFAAFKRHITGHNTEIKLISRGWEDGNGPID